MRVLLSRFIGFLVILFILIALFFALIPTILNTDWGRRQTVAWLNRSIPGNIEIQHLSLHWGHGQVVEGLLLKDPEGQAVLEFDKFSTEATLWQLLTKNPSWGHTQIEDLNAAIITDHKGETNLQRALGIEGSQATPPLSSSTIVLSNVNLDSYLFAPDHPLSAKIKGLTRQENLNGSFDINLSLDGLWATNWEGLKRDAQNYFSIEKGKNASIQARIVNFPVDLLDRLAALQNPQLNGLFHSLIGDRLNINLDKEPSDEGIAFNLTLSAPLMQGDLKGIIKKDALFLKEPGIFHLNLIPESINPFTSEHVEFLNPTRVEVVFSELIVPLNFFSKNRESDPCLFGFNVELKVPETLLDINPIGEAKLLNLEAYLTSEQCNKRIEIEVIGQAQQGKTPFDIHFTSQIDKPQNLSDLSEKWLKSLRSTLTVSELPLQVIPFFHKNPEWIEKLGPNINAQLEIEPKNQNEWLGTFSFQTPHVVSSEAYLNIGKDITLVSPAEFTWKMSNDCLKTIFKQDNLVLDQPCSLHFVIKRLKIPLDDSHLTNFEIESAIPQLGLSKLIDWGTLKLEDAILKVDGQNLGDLNTHLTGKLSLLTSKGTLSPLTPEPLSFEQSSKWKMGNQGSLIMPFGHLQMTNTITNIQVETALNAGNILELTQPAQVQYALSPAAFQELGQILHRNWPQLQEPAPIKLSVDPTEFDLKSFNVANLYLQGLLQIKKIVLQDQSGDLPILEDMIIPWVIDSPRNNIYTNVKGLAYNRKEGKPSQISAHLQFWLRPGQYNIAHADSEIRMSFTGMPTSMLNILFSMPDLNPIVGPILDLSVKGFYDPTHDKAGYWDMVIDSANFHSEARFRLTDRLTIYEENKLPIFRLTVTPESYRHIQKLVGIQDSRQLSSSFTAAGVISEMDIPIQENWMDKASFQFKFNTTNIQWKDSSLPSWKIEGRLFSQNLKDALNLSVAAQAKTPLTIDATVKGIFDQANGIREWQQMGIKAKLDGQQVSPSLLQSVFPLSVDQKQQLQALFGESIDLHASAETQNLNGPCKVSIRGSEGSIQLDGQLKNGVLTLSKPLEGSFKMTPRFIQTFLAPNVPILSTAVGAENPLTFSVEPSQFSCPLIPFQLDQVRIGKGNLTLGKINFRNEGELQSVLSVIRPIKGQYLTIWFTPIYFDLNGGKLSLKRFDMLVGHAYTLANWGTINLMTHQADFVLGITAYTLQDAFGVQGLDEKYILQIPLYMAKGKVEIDKKKAAARISSLVAQTHGGEKGKLIGNILDMVLSEKGEPSPAPTTQPFPWQGEFDSSLKSNASPSQQEDNSVQAPENSTDEKKKKKKKNKLLDDDNLKDLQEGALQLLDQWLK